MITTSSPALRPRTTSRLAAEVSSRPDLWLLVVDRLAEVAPSLPAKGARVGPLPGGLAAQVAATGAHLEHRDLDPLAELVRVHRLCLAETTRLGLDPDHPRHLTRSVVLEGEVALPDARASGRETPA